jgi:hypothetical protein
MSLALAIGATTVLAVLGSSATLTNSPQGQDPDEPQPELPLGMLSEDGDRHVIADGPAAA